MGGRGKWSYTSGRIVNYNKAVIRRNKISDYVLNPSKAKGKDKFLKSLGYSMKNHERLKKDLLQGSKNNPVRVSEPNKYGRIHYQVNMEIGIDKKAKVVTVWVKDKGDSAPRFETLRPYKGKKDDF